MKPFSQKDYVILFLMFVLLFILSSFGMMATVSNTIAYETLALEQPIVTALSIAGQMLTTPILFMIVMPFHLLSLLGIGLPIDHFFALMPLLTAILYSLFFMIALAMFNNRKLK